MSLPQTQAPLDAVDVVRNVTAVAKARRPRERPQQGLHGGWTVQRHTFEMPEPGTTTFCHRGHAYDIQRRPHPAPALAELDVDLTARHRDAENVGPDAETQAVSLAPHDLHRVQVGVEFRRPLQVAEEAPHLVEGSVDDTLFHPDPGEQARQD